jgi:hypothetical protein
MTEIKNTNLTNNPMSMSLCISPSIMSLKEYFISIFETNDTLFTEEWGWFVDIENIQIKSPLFKNNKYNKNITKYVFIPSTINENIGIRSMKSLNNLYDSSLLFEMDEEYEKKTTSNLCSFKVNICCLICIVAFCILL